MDLPRLALHLGTTASVALLVGLVFLATQREGEAMPAFPVTDRDGTPLPIPDAPAVVSGVWNRLPVLLFAVPAKQLDGVDAARGAGSATPSIEAPGHPGLRLFVLSAKSTHLGCTVGFDALLPASPDVGDYDGDGLLDGRIVDPCSQYGWDAFHGGAHVIGPPAAPLPRLDVRIVDGRLEATAMAYRPG